MARRAILLSEDGARIAAIAPSATSPTSSTTGLPMRRGQGTGINQLHSRPATEVDQKNGNRQTKHPPSEHSTPIAPTPRRPAPRLRMRARTVRQRPFRTRTTEFRRTRASEAAFFLAGLEVERGSAFRDGPATSTSIRTQPAGFPLLHSAADPFVVRALVWMRPASIFSPTVFHGAPDEKANTKRTCTKLNSNRL